MLATYMFIVSFLHNYIFSSKPPCALPIARRHQRQVPARAPGEHLGRVGRRERRSGARYGKQWRSWATADGGSVDQIARAVRQIKETPDSRRIVVSAWNVGELDRMALLPCHALFQFYVAAGRLSCQLYQRSADALLGVPFNIASYALLTHMMAQQCDLLPGEFIWTGGDCHLYVNHLVQADLQLTREPYPLPELVIRRRPDSLFEYAFEDFEIRNYRHHPPIKAPIAV